MLTLASISPKKQRLLQQALADFDARWDEETGLLCSRSEGRERHATRESAFYALALLLRQEPGDAARADRILRSVMALQLLCPGEIWNGTFAESLEDSRPVRAAVDVSRLTAEARWQGDVIWTRVLSAFAARLQADPELKNREEELSGLLSASLRDVFPVVWETYDPNWREFIFSTFALILEEFETLLPAGTVGAMENAAREGLSGARFRAESGLTPLNTNVRVMHVFFFDAFARRFHDENLRRYAADYAARFTEEYLQYRAVAEFNSPTYNGVVLSYTGLLREKGGSPEVRRMGEILEDGLWRNLADFYNPAMGTLCGPFSRAYGLTMEGTALPLLMYLGLDSLPVDPAPAFGPETESAGVLCFSEPKIPAEVRPLLTEPRPERQVTCRFRELAERGEPGDNHSLCTATAWITDRLMLGAMAGSTNTSHQLHSTVALWRNTFGSVSGLRLRRSDARGRLRHLRTVFFDTAAEPGRIFGTVRNEAQEPVICHFEIESPAAAEGIYREGVWQADGLCCRPVLSVLTAEGAERPAEVRPEIKSNQVVWLTVPLNMGETLKMDLRFSLCE